MSWRFLLGSVECCLCISKNTEIYCGKVIVIPKERNDCGNLPRYFLAGITMLDLSTLRNDTTQE